MHKRAVESGAGARQAQPVTVLMDCMLGLLTRPSVLGRVATAQELTAAAASTAAAAINAAAAASPYAKPAAAVLPSRGWSTAEATQATPPRPPRLPVYPPSHGLLIVLIVL